MSHRTESNPRAIARLAPVLLLLVAFVLQIGYLDELSGLFSGSLVNAPFCGVDAEAHLYRAGGLLDGSEPGQNTFYFIPLYPLYLALLQSIAGSSLLLALYIQILLQMLGVAALYGIGRLLYSNLTGLLAALGLATYSYYLFYVPCFDQALLTVPALTLGVFFLLRYDRHPRLGWLFLAGLALAAATLSRPTTLLLFPVTIGWLFFYRDKHRSRPAEAKASHIYWRFAGRAAILMLPFLIAVAPITWHNYRVSGKFILLSDNFEVNLFTGNNPDASGLDSLAHVQSQPAVLRFEEVYPRVLDGQTSLQAEVIQYIMSQPGDWLTLTLHKAWLWFGEVDDRLVSPYFPSSPDRSRLLSRLPLEWQAVMVVALLGLLLVPMRTRPRAYLMWALYGTLSLATILFFVQLRFRLPFVPFVLLLAAAVLGAASAWQRQRSWRFWPVLAILLLAYPLFPSLWIFIVLFLLLAWWPLRQRNPSGVERYRPAAVLAGWAAVLVYMLLVGWWLKGSELASDVSQTVDHYLGPPLAANGVLGQSFQMDCNGLNQIEVTLGVFNEQHSQPVTFYLTADHAGGQLLYSETFDGSAVEDYERKRFSFPPIAGSVGQNYFFYLSSPASRPDQALTARGYTDTPLDRYPAGRAFAGELDALQPLQADFAFTASCLEGPTPAQILAGLLGLEDSQ